MSPVPPTGKILTGIDLVEGGKLSQKAKDTFVNNVIALLTSGNRDGKGLGLQPFASLVPILPIAGPPVPNPTNLSIEHLFWFDPDPVAALMSKVLIDKKQCPMFHNIIVDTLYEKTAVALNANGSTPLFPLFDVSCAFPSLKGFPIAIPDLASMADIMPPPKLLTMLPDLGIMPSVPIPPLPPIPPSFPDFSMGFTLSGINASINIPGLAVQAAVGIPELLLGLIKMPFDLIQKLVLPPDIGLVLNLIAFDFSAIFNILGDILLKLLGPFITVAGTLVLPKLMIASILVYLKNVIAMVAVDILGMLVGAGGAITKLVAMATGLMAPS